MIDQAFLLRKIARRQARPERQRTLALIGAEAGVGASLIARALARRSSEFKSQFDGRWNILDVGHVQGLAPQLLDGGAASCLAANDAPRLLCDGLIWLVAVPSDDGLLAAYSAVKQLAAWRTSTPIELLWNRAANAARAHAAQAALRRVCGRFLAQTIPMAGWMAEGLCEASPADQGDGVRATLPRATESAVGLLCQRLWGQKEAAHGQLAPAHIGGAA